MKGECGLLSLSLSSLLASTISLGGQEEGVCGGLVSDPPLSLISQHPPGKIQPHKPYSESNNDLFFFFFLRIFY